MRLIDADKLIEDVEVLKKQINKMITDINYITPTQCESVDMISRICECIMMELSAFEKAYKNIPTAFDVDKVVKHLEEKRFKSNWFMANNINDTTRFAIESNRAFAYDDAIEIVKVGGRNED